MPVDLLLPAPADLVQRLQREPHQVKHVGRDGGAGDGVGGRLEPREQIQRDDLGVRGVVGQQTLCRGPVAALGDRHHQRGVQAHQRGEELAAAVVSRPVTITVSSIPTLVGRTGATFAAAASTARITVFQPTPNALRIVSIGTLSAGIATVIRAAGLDHTARCAIDGVRSTNLPQPASQDNSRLRHRSLVARAATGSWRTVHRQSCSRCSSISPQRSVRGPREASPVPGRRRLGWLETSPELSHVPS